MGIASVRSNGGSVSGSRSYLPRLASRAMPARFCSRLIHRILPGRYCARIARNEPACSDIARPVDKAMLAALVTSRESPTNSTSRSPRSRANTIAQRSACHSASVFEPAPISSKKYGVPRTTAAASIGPGLGRQPPSKNTLSLRRIYAILSSQCGIAKFGAGLAPGRVFLAGCSNG